MCNLYHMAPREHVERYFRATAPEYSAAAVGPFGSGLFLRPEGDTVHGVLGQWGMIAPRSKARRPDSRARSRGGLSLAGVVCSDVCTVASGSVGEWKQI